MVTSEQIEDIKSRVKKAYEDVDCTDFLRKCVKIQNENLKKDYKIYKKKLPLPKWDLEAYKKNWLQDLNINATTNEEFSAIGFFLIALEEFNPDEV